MSDNGYTSHFSTPVWLALTRALLGRLKGQMNVIQTVEERFRLVTEALDAELSLKEERRRWPAELATASIRKAFVEQFLSYDLVEVFLKDPTVEDIMINANGPIFVHRAGEGLVRTEYSFVSAEALDTFVQKLVVFGGRTQLDALNDLELADVRGRVNIARSPFGPQITITRSRPAPFTILQLIQQGEMTYHLGAQFWLYVEGMRVRPANLLIAGGPGAGKTTLLNALLAFIPSRDRLVTIEDTLELNTSFLQNCSRLESTSSLNMAALVVNSLRMRPDRIIVGEVRGAEARDLMTAMNLGRYCMGTLHASFARETVLRLQNEPMNVPPSLINLVDVIVCLRKAKVDGKIRRVVGDVVETAGMEQQIVLLSPVWTYDQAREQTVEVSPSSIFRDKIATESGLTAQQIMQEVQRRAGVLEAMRVSGEYETIEAFTAFCQFYSEDPEGAITQLKKSERLQKR